MNLAEWTAAIVSELKAANFEVTEHQGFPLVPMPKGDDWDGHRERVRLLEFRTTLPTDRKIYREGMLFIPVGAGRAA